MRRRLFTLASVVSLLLCVATVGLWLCSLFAFAPVGQWWGSTWDGNNEYLGQGWIAWNGSFYWLREDRMTLPAPASAANHYHHGGIDPIPGIHLVQGKLGFAYLRRVSVWHERGANRLVTSTSQQLGFPLWLAAILLAVLPVRWLTGSVLKRRLRRGGHCVTCGYNLTGNVSGVCPECGTPIPSAEK